MRTRPPAALWLPAAAPRAIAPALAVPTRDSAPIRRNDRGGRAATGLAPVGHANLNGRGTPPRDRRPADLRARPPSSERLWRPRAAAARRFCRSRLLATRISAAWAAPCRSRRPRARTAPRTGAGPSSWQPPMARGRLRPRPTAWQRCRPKSSSQALRPSPCAWPRSSAAPTAPSAAPFSRFLAPRCSTSTWRAPTGPRTASCAK
mmetsp:Transcript_23363/g.88643  ORF Transcript_23363/g.88643 Transcript_23363/m.88643 type:complete len:205 (+) Transcript_23363:2110-2724(+)